MRQTITKILSGSYGLPSQVFRFVATLAVIVWLFSAIIIPIILNITDWISLQSIWDRWQTLNTGMLAFLASYLVLSSARYGDIMRTRRDLRAAMPALAHTLSRLSKYIKAGGELLLNELEIYVPRQESRDEIERAEIDQKIISDLKDIVRLASPSVAEFTSRLITELQVLHARLNQLSGDPNFRLDKTNLVYYTLGAATVRARIDYLFSYARGRLDHFDPHLSADQIREALPMFFEVPDNIGQERWANMIAATVGRANEPLTYDILIVPPDENVN